DGLAPGLCRRTGLWLQMEHGVDARYAALYVGRSDLSEIPSQRPDLWPSLCLSRKFCTAPQSRRNGAWQRIAYWQDGRRPLAALCQSARLPGLYVDTSRQKI